MVHVCGKMSKLVKIAQVEYIFSLPSKSMSEVAAQVCSACKGGKYLASISVSWGVEPDALRVAAVQDTECQICEARGGNMLKVLKCEQFLSLEIKNEKRE